MLTKFLRMTGLIFCGHENFFTDIFCNNELERIDKADTAK